MFETFTIALEQMLRVILLLALGYAFNKLKLVPRSTEHVLSRFVVLLFLPSLTLYSNMMECKVTSLAEYSQWVIYGAVFCFLAIGLSIVLGNRFGKGDAAIAGVYRYAFAIPNGGAVGTPVMLALYGTAGLFQYNLFNFVSTIMTYAWGVPQLLPHDAERPTFRSVFKQLFNLNFIAMLLGMALGLLGAPNWMPGFVVTAIDGLADCYVVVSLLMIGFSIADYPVREFLGEKKLYAYTLIRMLLIPGLFLSVLFAAKAPLMFCTMMAIHYASPCGMNVVVYPAAYGQDCKLGAGMVVVTSVVSILVLPLLYTVVQTFFG